MRPCDVSWNPTACCPTPRGGGPTTGACGGGAAEEGGFDYRQFLKARPNEPEALAKLVVYDLLHGLENEAIEVFERAKSFEDFRLERYLERAEAMDAEFCLAEEYEKRERWLKAYTLYKRIINMEMEKPSFRYFFEVVLLRFRTLLLLKLPKALDEEDFLDRLGESLELGLPRRGRGPDPQEKGRGPPPSARDGPGHGGPETGIGSRAPAGRPRGASTPRRHGSPGLKPAPVQLLQGLVQSPFFHYHHTVALFSSGGTRFPDEPLQGRYRMKRSILVVLLCLVAAFAGIAQTTIDKPVATLKLIRQEVISARQFKSSVEKIEATVGQKLTAEQRKQYLDKMIDDLLFMQFCEREKILVSDAEISAALSQMKSSLGPGADDTKLEIALRGQGIFLDARSYAKEQLLLQSYLKNRKGRRAQGHQGAELRRHPQGLRALQVPAHPPGTP